MGSDPRHYGPGITSADRPSGDSPGLDPLLHAKRAVCCTGAFNEGPGPDGAADATGTCYALLQCHGLESGKHARWDGGATELSFSNELKPPNFALYSG